jgi:alkanesulfonate monooxygenase SsuD/methylene tetrahydromethanopterin reductase-like flavin-dependent oxidoreductase (luciferase family)
MEFYEHPSFVKELKPIQKKHRGTFEGVESLKRLLTQQFDSATNIEVIGPGKINRLCETPVWDLWKVEVSIPRSGLKPSQWPRVWFVVSGNTITLLAAAMHGDNYSDNQVTALAKNRASEIYNE